MAVAAPLQARVIDEETEICGYQIPAKVLIF